MKKVVVLMLCLALMVFAAACTNGAPAEETPVAPDFTVEAVATEGDVAGTAADLLAAVMDAEGTVYELTDGAFAAIGEFANTETSGWQLYCDGAPIEAKAAEVAVVAGSTYSLIWGDFAADEAAPAEGDEVAPAEGADDPEAPAEGEEAAPAEGEEAAPAEGEDVVAPAEGAEAPAAE